MMEAMKIITNKEVHMKNNFTGIKTQKYNKKRMGSSGIRIRGNEKIYKLEIKKILQDKECMH